MSSVSCAEHSAARRCWRAARWKARHMRTVRWQRWHRMDKSVFLGQQGLRCGLTGALKRRSLRLRPWFPRGWTTDNKDQDAAFLEPSRGGACDRNQCFPCRLEGAQEWTRRESAAGRARGVLYRERVHEVCWGRGGPSMLDDRASEDDLDSV